MKNLKLKVIIGGLLLNGIICILLATFLPCDYLINQISLGSVIATSNVVADILWILIANKIINDYLKNKQK
jgi:hypothetical protein